MTQPTGLAQHRKLFTLIGSMLATFILNRLGLDAKELLGSTAVVNELVGGLVDLLIIGGIPALLMWVQPNEEGDSIFRYWRAMLVGGVGIIGAIAAIAWLS